MASPHIHKREKTESFGGSQMDFEFPNTSISDFNEVRSLNETFSEVSSNVPQRNFHNLTTVSISSGANTLNTSELFRSLETAGYRDDDMKSTLHKSQISTSSLSVKVKEDKSHHTGSSKYGSTISVSYSPSHKTVSLFMSRSPSVLQFRGSPMALNMTTPVRQLSTRSSLKRSNAIKHKEGWLTRLVSKYLKFKNRLQKWRKVVRKRAFNRRNNLKKSPSMISSPIIRSNSVAKSINKSPSMRRSNSLMRNTPVLYEAKVISNDDKQDHMNNYLQREQQLVDLENLSQEILGIPEQQQHLPTIKEYPSSFPTPNIDTNYNQQAEKNQEMMYQMWSHYLKQIVMNRIQLKLDINDYKDNRENKRDSVLESIISDYEEEFTDDDDGFESDTNNGHYSSLTSMSSYDDEEESDQDSIQASEVMSDYQSSYYPTRQNSVNTNRTKSIKRQQSVKVLNRMLSVNSKVSAANSNMTYIEDLVNIKFNNNAQDSKPYVDKYYSYSNPYMGAGTRNVGMMTRSPSFVIPKRSNTLLSVREE